MEILGPSDFESIVGNLRDGLYFTDRDRNVLYWNKAAEQITGFTSAEVIGKSCMDNVLCHIDAHGMSLCKGMCPLAATILDGQAREADVFLHHKDGHRVPVSVRTNPLRNPQGKIIGAIELFSSASKDEYLWEKLEELQQLALIDPVSRLPNRKYLEQQLNSQAAQLERFQLPYGVASFRIENSTDFIQKHGEARYLRLIQIVSDTFRHSLRPYDTAGRIDTDEFLGIFPNVDTFALHTICRRLTHECIHSTIREEDGSQVGFHFFLRACMALPQENVGAMLLRLDQSLLTLKP